jgi:hypothetical protein
MLLPPPLQPGSGGERTNLVVPPLPEIPSPHPRGVGNVGVYGDMKVGINYAFLNQRVGGPGTGAERAAPESRGCILCITH